ncbi:MAG: glycerophosphodiester phosphodiesterase [Sphaerochaeta sp.]
MTAPLITAHSGCEGTERDSLESVQQAVELGADAVEVDVRMAPDGVLRISHDKKLSGTRNVVQASLEDVFSMIGPTPLSINCDIKEREHLYALFRLAEQCGFSKDRLIVSGSVSPEQLAYDPGIADRATLYMNIEELFKYLYLFNTSFSFNDFSRLMTEPWAFTRSYMKQLDEYLPAVIDFSHHLGIRTINFPYQHVKEHHCRILQEADLFVSVWTVDDSNALQTFCDFSLSNLENVTTRNVRVAKSIFGTHKTVVSQPFLA